MDKVIAVLFLFSFIACKESQKDPVNSNPKTKDIPAMGATMDSLPGRPLHNWQLLDTANRENIFEDTVPVFLKEFARKNDFPCPDTVTGCAACGYCAYVKLSDDWSYFAYERQETKHYCEVKIYNIRNNRIFPVDTLFGTIINALPTKQSKIYQLTLLEAYWEDLRPMNVEFYRYEKGRFILKDTIIGK